VSNQRPWPKCSATQSLWAHFGPEHSAKRKRKDGRYIVIECLRQYKNMPPFHKCIFYGIWKNGNDGIINLHGNY